VRQGCTSSELNTTVYPPLRGYICVVSVVFGFLTGMVNMVGTLEIIAANENPCDR